jgi:hypothetical protein
MAQQRLHQVVLRLSIGAAMPFNHERGDIRKELVGIQLLKYPKLGAFAVDLRNDIQLSFFLLIE